MNGNPLWQGQYIPEGYPVPFMWPLVVLSKLEDDPGHAKDPASLQAQGDATHPVVILQGITLAGSSMASANVDTDSLFSTASKVALNGFKVCKAHDPYPCGEGAYLDAQGNPVITTQDHLTVMVRPAAICFNTLFDETKPDKHGNIVTPYLFSESADYNFAGAPMPVANTPVVPLDLLTNNDPSRFQASNLVEAPAGTVAGKDPPAIEGCLPVGRYAINVVYPDGQAWTVPNEAGACTGSATGEGDTNWASLTCSAQPRPVIRSQGPRAVVEITKTTNPKNCTQPYSKTKPLPPGQVPAVPTICMPTQ